jgi:hypothetical protein
MILKIENGSRTYAPLETITVQSDIEGSICVRDGTGREYSRNRISEKSSFKISGSLGTHTVFLLDEEKKIISTATFRVECKTFLKDGSGKYENLLEMLKFTMNVYSEKVSTIRLGHKFYRYYVCWLRDHVHTLKGMKYFDNGDLKTGIELYADYQRKDGMIWDRIEKYGPNPTWRDMTFSYGDFVMTADRDWRFERIPAENDVEYLFVEGLYYTWKATGDNEWMKTLLDKAIKAMNYSLKDPYRWSKKYGLLKRGYTIDTWDFVSEYDIVNEGGAMCVDKKRTRFGIMHGDNTGFAMSCEYIAEMLEYSGRKKEAAKFIRLGKSIRKRLDKISWNGKFFTHHVSEDKAFKRDLGVDESKQVSLSNAYAINRKIGENQRSEIIKTYQKIREKMPSGSPGEFYQIYPPFEKGFGDHNDKWEYMNGGVTTIVAGELAHGAFENGFEKYGIDILDRMIRWGKDHHGYFPCCLRGDKVPDNVSAKFAKIDIRSAANVDFAGTKGENPCPAGWNNDGKNDLSEMPVGTLKFQNIPFDVIDPSKNRRRACVGLSTNKLYQREVSLEIGKRAKSIYFLHAYSGKHSIAGLATIQYADGSKFAQYMEKNRQIGNWFMPEDSIFVGGEKNFISPDLRVAWRGKNAKFDNVGAYVYGMRNPHPEKIIEKITLNASETGNIWFVLGITLSDSPVALPRTDVSFGIPDNWGAGAVVYALIEGLIGVVDTGKTFDRAQISPRWLFTDEKSVNAVVKYEGSGGYVAYEWKRRNCKQKLILTSSAEEIIVRLPLLNGAKPIISVNGSLINFKIGLAGGSRYAKFTLKGVGTFEIQCN